MLTREALKCDEVLGPTDRSKRRRRFQWYSTEHVVDVLASDFLIRVERLMDGKQTITITGTSNLAFWARATTVVPKERDVVIEEAHGSDHGVIIHVEFLADGRQRVFVENALNPALRLTADVEIPSVPVANENEGEDEDNEVNILD